MAAREDRFANIAASSVTETAANTLTFVEMLTGISLGQGVGMLIDQIDYHIGASALQDLVAADDTLEMAITASNDVSDLSDVTDRRIIHQMKVQAMIVGAVVSLSHIVQPYPWQFFPPLIIASPRIHLAAKGTSLVGAATVSTRIYFRYIALTPQQYLELAEAFVLTG